MKPFIIKKKYKKSYKGEKNSQYYNWCNHRQYYTREARDRELERLNSECRVFDYKPKNITVH